MQGKYHSIGMVGIAARDIESFRGKINMGDRVQIIGIDNVDPSRGYKLLDLSTGVMVIETGFNSIIPITFENDNDLSKTGKTR